MFRWLCGVVSLLLLALTVWCLVAEPARRSFLLAGKEYALSLRLLASWTGQAALLAFAGSRHFYARSRGRAPRGYEVRVIRAARAAALSMALMAAAWLAWPWVAK
jgi:hypothetical protein